MPWSEVFIAFFVCHLAGDFLLQTEWQAINKHGGLTSGDPEKRAALFSHVLSYMIPFAPALVWIADQQDVTRAVIAGVLLFVTHLVQDDGKALKAYVYTVKKTDPPAGSPLWIAIDQSFHLVVMFGIALLVGA